MFLFPSLLVFVHFFLPFRVVCQVFSFFFWDVGVACLVSSGASYNSAALHGFLLSVILLN